MDIGVSGVSRLEVQDLLREFDGDGDGRLDRSEFQQVMAKHSTETDVLQAFAAIDIDGDGSLSMVRIALAPAQSRTHAAAHGRLLTPPPPRCLPRPS